jgi:hypothetical protein
MMNKAKDIAGRIVALFLTNALGVVTGAAVIAPDLEVWKSALIAGAVSIFKVAEGLAKASIDGVLTKDEIDAVLVQHQRRLQPRRHYQSWQNNGRQKENG